MLDTTPLLLPGDFPELRRAAPRILQVNLGRRCNQSCLHCHVDAGPQRREMMSRETVDEVIRLLQQGHFETLDLTGGAPELNPHFRHLVSSAVDMGVQVMDRCNLTVLLEPGQEGLAEFLAEHGVHLVSSLPCYLQENVDRQRGGGVFEASIRALRQLNRLGYGKPGSGLQLDLVFNPQDAVLPPAQCTLERDYKQRLQSEHGIVFNRLLTLTNMPIRRFGSMLVSHGRFHDYLALLKSAHLEANLEGVMCRTLVSVDWQGWLYDCDFNQALDLPMKLSSRARTHLRDLDPAALEGVPIQVGDHCYGCTAGQGSSCGGALR